MELRTVRYDLRLRFNSFTEMDRINGLSDDLLVKIISFLPTKDAVSTSILSKRWECLWLWLPKLEFEDGDKYTRSRSECERFQCFLDRKLPLHKAPVMESFRLKNGLTHLKRENIKLWLVTALTRDVRELKVAILNRPREANILPSSLYNCKSLVTLTLRGDMRFDVPRNVCLSSLKTLKIHRRSRLHGELLRRFLSVCPILENLWVDFYVGEGHFTINVPSLLSLSLTICSTNDGESLEINTPSLKYLKLVDSNSYHPSILTENMPKLEEAYLNVRRHVKLDSLIRSITSVKRLTLCAMVVYGNSYVFNQLEHLKLCDCRECSSNLQAQLRKDSPNLRVVDISQMGNHRLVALDTYLRRDYKL